MDYLIGHLVLVILLLMLLAGTREFYTVIPFVPIILYLCKYANQQTLGGASKTRKTRKIWDFFSFMKAYNSRKRNPFGKGCFFVTNISYKKGHTNLVNPAIYVVKDFAGDDGKRIAGNLYDCKTYKKNIKNARIVDPRHISYILFERAPYLMKNQYTNPSSKGSMMFACPDPVLEKGRKRFIDMVLVPTGPYIKNKKNSTVLDFAQYVTTNKHKYPNWAAAVKKISTADSTQTPFRSIIADIYNTIIRPGTEKMYDHVKYLYPHIKIPKQLTVYASRSTIDLRNNTIDVKPHIADIIKNSTETFITHPMTIIIDNQNAHRNTLHIFPHLSKIFIFDPNGDVLPGVRQLIQKFANNNGINMTVHVSKSYGTQSWLPCQEKGWCAYISWMETVLKLIIPFPSEQVVESSRNILSLYSTSYPEAKQSGAEVNRFFAWKITQSMIGFSELMMEKTLD